ncbi:MAG TPA: PQQ-dependent sugar dehydrogenase [Croceibacterium sp.]
MTIRTALVAGIALMSLGSALSAQNTPAPAPAAAPAPRPAGFPQPQPLGDGPWDVQTWGAKLHVEVVTKGLDHPWGMAFLPDGSILVTERPGRLRVIRDGVLDPKPIEGLLPIYATGIAGLTDIVLDPNFASNRLIYLAYSKAAPDTPAGTNPNQTDATLAVMRAKWDGGSALTDVRDIFVADAWYGKPPLPPKCCGQGPASGSFGGRLAIGPDGKLYVSSGDRNFGERVQDTSNHFGKILRLNLDGSVPADNPFVGRAGYKPEIWTIGHRNQLGLVFDPANGNLWETEFGPRGGDEVNLITKGSNYGWIDVTQGRHYNQEPARKGERGVEGYVDPVWAFQPSGNPGNIAIYRGSAFGAWQGNLLVPNMGRPASLVRLVLSPDGHVVATEQMLGDLGQRLRDVRVAPDGSVYLLTDETAGAVLRITPGS